MRELFGCDATATLRVAANDVDDLRASMNAEGSGRGGARGGTSKASAPAPADDVADAADAKKADVDDLWASMNADSGVKKSSEGGVKKGSGADELWAASETKKSGGGLDIKALLAKMSGASGVPKPAASPAASGGAKLVEIVSIVNAIRWGARVRWISVLRRRSR